MYYFRVQRYEIPSRLISAHSNSSVKIKIGCHTFDVGIRKLFKQAKRCQTGQLSNLPTVINNSLRLIEVNVRVTHKPVKRTPVHGNAVDAV